MRDKDNQEEKQNFNELKDSACKVKALEDENSIQRLRSQISRMTGEVANSASVVKVLFKNEVILRKYKSKVELFLKDLLVEGEEFVIHCEMQDNTEQEFEDLHQAFHIDKFKDESCAESSLCGNIPFYSKAYEDILHDDEQQAVEKCEKGKPQTVTCFNCLGDHHMKNCPEKFDRMRIAANKKDLTVTLTNRYHEEERKNLIQPGCLSSELREAMGLKSNQLPRYIYHMRIIGYPPGWMKEAVLETSGLSLYDSDGKISFEEETSSVSGIQYDASKFVNYPGFNSPVPDNYTDEWKVLNMPPLQQHQQLSEAVKSPNIVKNHNVCKRKSVSADNEVKKAKNDMNDCSDSCSSDIPENKFSSSENEEMISSPRTPQNTRSQSLSLSKSEGTPILEQGNPYNKLPDADKFAQGITEHLPFENLPDAVGKYEKMRGVLSGLQKKLHDIRS